MSRNHDNDNGGVLESQFILRLPQEPAKILREAIRNNSNLRDRITIKIDNDMRHGEVRVDHWLLQGKIVDLPTIVESMKTIDGKGFYKTADICKMMLCKEEDDQTTDEDSPQKTKRKDSNKVDKKYLHPHGITPPMKNVRKRRFRKTLKKKYVEAPEIEKEVKRLLREDNESVVSVKWEVINEEDVNKINKGTVIKKEPVDNESTHNVDDSICKIFGGAVSDSEDEDAQLNVLELDENSQNSADDSHLTDSNSVMNNSADSKVITEFSSDMFHENQNSSPTLLQDLDFYDNPPGPSATVSYNSRGSIERRLEEVQVDLEQLKARCYQHDIDIDNSDNLNLRQRLQDIRDRTLQEQLLKEQEQCELQDLLKQVMI